MDGLRVAARSVVCRFKDQPNDAKLVGRELGVDFLLEGSVQRSADRLRITVHLVSVKDGFDLWAQRYERAIEDLFLIQDEVCEAIIEKLRTLLFDRQAQTTAPHFRRFFSSR